MKAYSTDLRQKVMDAVDSRLGTIREIAEMFGVNESFIYKLLRHRRRTGTIEPMPHGGGAQLKLHQAALEVLRDLIKDNPDATLEELRVWLKKQARVDVSLPTICRGLQKLGLPVKKRPSFPKKRIRASAGRFGRNNADLTPND